MTDELVIALEEIFAARVTDPAVVDLQWLRGLVEAGTSTLSAEDLEHLTRIANDLSDVYAKGFNAGRRYARSRSNVLQYAAREKLRIDEAKVKKIPMGVSGIETKKAKRSKQTDPVLAKISLEDLGL